MAKRYSEKEEEAKELKKGHKGDKIEDRKEKEVDDKNGTKKAVKLFRKKRGIVEA